MTIEDYCEELDAMLAACDEGTPSLDEVHGFMSAVLCGPRALSFREWVCAIFLPEAPDAVTGECELPAALIEMLSRLYDDTLRSIADGSFLPIVSCTQDDDEDADAQQWCSGFMMGIAHNREQWRLGTAGVLDLLTPIVLLADPREFKRAVAKVQNTGADAFKQELLEALPGSVCALRDFFKKSPRARRPVRSANRSSKPRRSTRR